jgi:hypothetical protein
MTVLPNAPIDSTTGLPIPTIAVATDGGVSVIKDDGTVVDITTTGSWIKTQFVEFREDNKVVFTIGYTGQTNADRYVHILDIPSNDLSIGNGLENHAHGRRDAATDLATLFGPTYDINAITPSSSLGHAQGLSLVKNNETNYDNGSVAYLTSTYNSGYMTGDIKLAALSDTDDTDVVGSGTNIISGWANHPSYPFETYTGSGLDITSAINTTSYGVLNRTYHPVIGRTYTVKFNLTLNSGTAPTFFGQSSSSVGAGAIAFVPVAGANSFTWVGTTAISSYVNIMSGSGVASDFSISGFTMYVGGEEDRSVKANGLAVHGTITKTAVATGADLVAYSGFSTANYLEQPYNSDLDFGTGDFSVSCWVKQASSASERIMDREGGINDNYIIVYTSNGAISVSTKDGGSSINLSAPTSPFGVWQLITIVRSSGILYL